MIFFYIKSSIKSDILFFFTYLIQILYISIEKWVLSPIHHLCLIYDSFLMLYCTIQKSHKIVLRKYYRIVAVTTDLELKIEFVHSMDKCNLETEITKLVFILNWQNKMFYWNLQNNNFVYSVLLSISCFHVVSNNWLNKKKMPLIISTLKTQKYADPLRRYAWSLYIRHRRSKLDIFSLDFLSTSRNIENDAITNGKTRQWWSFFWHPSNVCNVM